VGWFAYAPLTSQTFSRGTQHGLLDTVAAGFRLRQHRNRDQHHRHDPVHALQGNDAREDAAVRLAQSRDGGLVILAVSPLTAAQLMLLVDRYLGWTLLRHAGRRLGGDVDALLLDLRPSGSLCARHPGFCVRFRNHSRFLPQGDFRLPGDGGGNGSHRIHQHERLGAPHVHGRHEFGRKHFFVLSTMAIAVPTGIKIFNWLATMWGGKIHFKTPMLFCIAFLFQFLIAGLTGVMLARRRSIGSSEIRTSWSRTFTTSLWAAFSSHCFGAFYYWFPKMSGRMYNETLGKLHFWLFLIGFHLTFDFMHIPGILGMPRRIYTYEPGRGWDIWNLIVTIGVFFQAAGVLVCWQPALVVLPGKVRREAIRGMRGRSNGPPVRRPRRTTSRIIPEVRSRRPLWDLKHPEDPDWQYE
jgi:cytochrome c oxidase subunit I